MNKLYLTILSAVLLSACATESSQVLNVPKVETYQQAYNGVKAPLAVGKFDSRGNLGGGIFSNSNNQLTSQAKTLLMTDLQQTGRFVVLDRTNMDEIRTEASIKGMSQKLKGARYVVTGDISEFGRKNVGDEQLFGILGQGKTQVAYAKVTLNIVDVQTSEIVYSSQGAGEFKLSTREILGTGGHASYDGTLNGKVLDLAIREAVNNLVKGIEQGNWNPQP
ncbi:CsgG/HfaB family protein [Snodgrassella gandavensis]|uniref:CsgG/HfaB family protein n=1 Tax=Snodgrassella gandavensis TaxID=2946698 RepID=UPI001EF661F2|nr:CsgG/HfaB family protein [Snodgrassella gandavensis]